MHIYRWFSFVTVLSFWQQNRFSFSIFFTSSFCSTMTRSASVRYCLSSACRRFWTDRDVYLTFFIETDYNKCFCRYLPVAQISFQFLYRFFLSSALNSLSCFLGLKRQLKFTPQSKSQSKFSMDVNQWNMQLGMFRWDKSGVE